MLTLLADIVVCILVQQMNQILDAACCQKGFCILLTNPLNLTDINCSIVEDTLKPHLDLN